MTFEYNLPTHKRDQVQAGLRESTDSEIAAVVGCLRGMAESFDALDITLTSAQIAAVLRTSANQFDLVRPEADPA